METACLSGPKGDGGPVPPAEDGRKDDYGKPRMTLVPASFFDVQDRWSRDHNLSLGAVNFSREDAFNIAFGAYNVLYRCGYSPHEEVAKVLTFGAEKYGAGNWRKVDNACERYADAALRHANARAHLDAESGLPHAAHALCCALFLLELMGVEVRQDDDE